MSRFHTDFDPIDDEPLADINVTPFVDVVLVLLIIFMITAAVVEFGMQVSVPPTTTVKAQPQRSSNTSTISPSAPGSRVPAGGR